jgi:hypothetical protein
MLQTQERSAYRSATSLFSFLSGSFSSPGNSFARKNTHYSKKKNSWDLIAQMVLGPVPLAKDGGFRQSNREETKCRDERGLHAICGLQKDIPMCLEDRH